MCSLAFFAKIDEIPLYFHCNWVYGKKTIRVLARTTIFKISRSAEFSLFATSVIYKAVERGQIPPIVPFEFRTKVTKHTTSL